MLPEKIQGFTGISIRGEIELGDDEKFESLALGIEQGIVFLDSAGGRIVPALKIGKALRLRGYLAAVPHGTQCASACGLVWLGGKERLVFPGGSVGFHVAYRESGGEVIETGQGNALIGAYLNQLGLPERAIEYVTRAAPDSMIWLTQSDADRYGITAYFVPSNDPSVTSDKPPNRRPEDQEGTQTPKFEAFERAEGRDVYGFDITASGIELSSVDACETACSQESSCVAYSFNKKGKCYLKSGGDRLVWNKEVIAGYRASMLPRLKPAKIAFHSSTDLRGKEYDYMLHSSVEECMARCEAASQCTGFTFARKDQGRCSLRSGQLRKLPSKRIMSGVKTSE